jgi:hypothetical protein
MVAKAGRQTRCGGACEGVSEFREIRLRLNLRRERDRWLSSALDEEAEVLGVPVASLLRRALVHYFRNREAADETRSRRRNDGGRWYGRRAAVEQPVEEGPQERAQARGGDPWVEDDADEVADALASLGAPPELPRASG